MTAETFGQWLKQRRKALDLTQEALARQAGCAAITLRKLEADQTRASAELAGRLAQLLEIPPGEMEVFKRLARGLPVPESIRSPSAQSPPPLPPTNLLTPLTPLIGREHDLDRLGALLSSNDLRLVTLSGPPGIGKTRLSLQAGKTVLSQFPDGVFFVALAPIADPGLAPRTIAQALGIPETAGQSLTESLKVALRDRQILLVLDNFEHILEAAPLVSELLATAPGLKVLATSREALNLYGEVEFKMQPLALPEPGDLVSLDTLAGVASVRLFIQRAQAVNAEFQLNRANAAAVAEVCTRLDGLPLAIELAAARSNLFGPRALLKRLDHRLDLLTSRTRDLPPRQQTLRGAIEWSYSLLDESERSFYRRLGVFAGSFDLEAARAVCDPHSDTSDGVLGVLASLVDKSLVLSISMESQGLDTAEEGDEPRFMLLETLREYAREQLELSGEAESVRRRHARHFLALAEAADPQQVGVTPPVQRWLEHLDLDRPNLLAALDWLVSHSEVELSLRLTGALWPFWAIRGYLSEGRQAIQAALTLAQEAEASLSPNAFLARAFNGAGHLALDQGDVEMAQPFIETSLSFWRELGNPHGVAWSLYGLGLITLYLHESDVSRRLLDESLVVSRAAGDLWCTARSLELLSVIEINESNFSLAQAYLDECLAVFRKFGDAEGTALALNTIGRISRAQGRFSQARQAYEECRETFSKLKYWQQLAWVHYNFGELAMDEGHFEQAQAFIEQSLALSRRIGNEQLKLEWLPDLGLIAYWQGDLDRARSYLQQGLETPHPLRWLKPMCCYGLGLVTLDDGDPQAALQYFKDGLTQFLEMKKSREAAEILEAIARAFLQTGQPAAASRLFGATEALREAIGAPIPPFQHEIYRSNVEALRTALDPAAFAQEWAAGRNLSPQEAVNLTFQAGEK